LIPKSFFNRFNFINMNVPLPFPGIKQAGFGLLLLFMGCMPAQLSAQQEPTAKKGGVIIGTDDIMMYNSAARGAEPFACCPFTSTRTFKIKPGMSAQVNWTEAKRLGRDTIRIIRIEISKINNPETQFTLALHPKAQPAFLECMSGFGCEGEWEPYPWKSPDGNFLEHTNLQFKLTPNNLSYFTIYNLDTSSPILVRINPCNE
jgi:hypothetical protein